MSSVIDCVLAALGQWQADRCGTAQSRGNAGNDIDRNTGSFKSGLLFAAAAEDIGIAAFEANDAASGSCFGDQNAIDLALLGRGLIGCFADRNAGRIAARHFENCRPDEAVIDDDVGFDQLALGFERQEFRIAGAGAHERDAPCRWGGVSGKRGFKLAGIGRTCRRPSNCRGSIRKKTSARSRGGRSPVPPCSRHARANLRQLAARRPRAAGSNASMRARKPWPSIGAAPSVPIATTSGSRSTMAGWMKVDNSARSTTLTAMLRFAPRTRRHLPMPCPRHRRRRPHQDGGLRRSWPSR